MKWVNIIGNNFLSHPSLNRHKVNKIEKKYYFSVLFVLQVKSNIINHRKTIRLNYLISFFLKSKVRFLKIFDMTTKKIFNIFFRKVFWKNLMGNGFFLCHKVSKNSKLSFFYKKI